MYHLGQSGQTLEQSDLLSNIGLAKKEYIYCKF